VSLSADMVNHLVERRFLLVLTLAALSVMLTAEARVGQAPPLPMISWMSMYDMQEIQAANDEIWENIAKCLHRHGIAAPLSLTRSTTSSLYDIWTHPQLLVAQACGYPWITQLKQWNIPLIGTPVYDVSFCYDDDHPNLLARGFYRSLIIVNSHSHINIPQQLQGKRAAINSIDSNSGMNVFRHFISQLQAIETRDTNFFEAVKLSGSHFNSMVMVANGSVDVASIDCVTYAHVNKAHPELTENLKIIAKTIATPTLPFISSNSTDANTLETLRMCIEETLENPSTADARKTLFLTGMRRMDEQDYHIIKEIEEQAKRAGYPSL
jgi:ABC-type phosphate/phosphonate transport system substrate-binding protein